MAILTGHKGNWGTPEHGVTEYLQGGLNSFWNFLRPGSSGNQNPFGSLTKDGGSGFTFNNNTADTPQAGITYLNNQTTNPVIPPANTPPPNQINTGGGNTGGGNTGGGNTGGGNTGGGNTGGGQVLGTSQTQGQAAPSAIDQINSAFEQEQGYLGGLESSAQQRADSSRSLMTNEYSQLVPQIDAEQASRNTELTNREDTARKDYYQGLGQVKQAANDSRNKYESYLAYSGGGFNTSAKDAISELLGRRFVQSIGEANLSRTNVINAINVEKDKVTNFYTSKKSELRNNYLRGVQDIENQLSDAVSQVRAAKVQSAQAKAQATMDSWNRYSTQRAQLNMALYQFDKQLELFREQKGQAFTAATSYINSQTPNYDTNAGLANYFTTPAPNQSANSVPTYNSQAQVSAKRKTDEEQLYADISSNPTFA